MQQIPTNTIPISTFAYFFNEIINLLLSKNKVRL